MNRTHQALSTVVFVIHKIHTVPHTFDPIIPKSKVFPSPIYLDVHITPYRCPDAHHDPTMTPPPLLTTTNLTLHTPLVDSQQDQVAMTS